MAVVVLDAVAHVVLHTAFVVDPRHAEREYAVGDAEAFDQVVAVELGMLVVGIFDGGDYFLHGLEVFRFVGKTPTEVVEHFGCFHLP